MFNIAGVPKGLFPGGLRGSGTCTDRDENNEAEKQKSTAKKTKQEKRSKLEETKAKDRTKQNLASIERNPNPS